MKSLYVIILTLVLAPLVHAESRYIQIGQLKLFLAYAPSDSPNQLREYLPKGQDLESWTRLASIRTLPNLKDPVAYLQAVAIQVKQSHPFAQYRAYQRNKEEPIILDFMTFSPADSPVRFIEWNLMRAEPAKDRGLTLYQYAMRIYNPTEESARSINTEREKMLSAFAKASFVEKETK